MGHKTPPFSTVRKKTLLPSPVPPTPTPTPLPSLSKHKTSVGSLYHVWESEDVHTHRHGGPASDMGEIATHTHHEKTHTHTQAGRV